MYLYAMPSSDRPRMRSCPKWSIKTFVFSPWRLSAPQRRRPASAALLRIRANHFRSYRKIPKISPSKYKPPKPVTQKNPPLNRPSKYKPPGACTRKIALKYKLKESKNGKFTSNHKASPIDFETQISVLR